MTLPATLALGRRPTGGELVRIMRRESRFLLVCVPQIVLLVALTVVGLGMSDSVRVVIWASAASLGFWGGVASWRAGLGRGGIALGVVTGWLAGGAVLLLQVFLQPGEAITNGVAAIRLGRGLIG